MTGLIRALFFRALAARPTYLSSLRASARARLLIPSSLGLIRRCRDLWAGRGPCLLCARGRAPLGACPGYTWCNRGARSARVRGFDLLREELSRRSSPLCRGISVRRGTLKSIVVSKRRGSEFAGSSLSRGSAVHRGWG